MSVPTEPCYLTNLKDRARELIELAGSLNQEYAELMETSVLLREESKSLREESRRLRQAGVRLGWTLNPS